MGVFVSSITTPFSKQLVKMLFDLLDSSFQAWAVCLTVPSLSYFVIKWLLNTDPSKRYNARSYPPGPPRRPLIGAAGSFPKDHLYQNFCEWEKLYGMIAYEIFGEREHQSNNPFYVGDVIYAPILGIDIVVINSYEVAQQILSKRPASTAGRRVPYLLEHL